MTDVLQNLIERFGASTSIVPPVASVRPSWLDTFTREKRTFLRPRLGIQPPYPDTDAAYEDQCLEHIEYDVRVYTPIGHVTRIVLTEDYARRLDAIRNLHQSGDNSGDARSKWSDDPLRFRARPEDFELHLGELPDSSYIGEIYMLDWDNPFDPWLLFKGGLKSLAAATNQGNVEFYRAELNGWLGLNVKHEWCHLAQARFPNSIADWNNSVSIEWYEWLPDPNALKSREEHFALLGQMLMHRAGKEFLRGGVNTVARTVAFFDVIEQSLNAASRQCPYEAIWRERIRVVREELLTLAADKAAQRLQVATNLTAYLTARAAGKKE